MTSYKHLHVGYIYKYADKAFPQDEARLKITALCVVDYVIEVRVNVLKAIGQHWTPFIGNKDIIWTHIDTRSKYVYSLHNFELDSKGETIYDDLEKILTAQ